MTPLPPATREQIVSDLVASAGAESIVRATHLRTAGWSQQQTEWRNTSGTDVAISHSYKIQATAGMTGDVTNREVQNLSYDGIRCIMALKEQGGGASRSAQLFRRRQN